MSFHVCLASKIKKTKQASKEKKIKSLNFAELKVHRKTNAHRSLETYNFFFFSLKLKQGGSRTTSLACFRDHIFAIIVILDLKIHQSMWIH